MPTERRYLELHDEIKEALFEGFAVLGDEESIKRRKACFKIIDELESRSAFEYVSPIFRNALEAQLRTDGQMSESEIQSHIMDKCEKIKALHIADRKKEFGIDVEENPELVAERMRDQMIETAKKLNEVAT